MQGKRVIDLTHVMIPGQEQYDLEITQRSERHGPTGDIMKDVFMWSYVGTHVEVRECKIECVSGGSSQ